MRPACCGSLDSANSPTPPGAEFPTPRGRRNCLERIAHSTSSDSSNQSGLIQTQNYANFRLFSATSSGLNGIEIDRKDSIEAGWGRHPVEDNLSRS